LAGIANTAVTPDFGVQVPRKAPGAKRSLSALHPERPVIGSRTAPTFAGPPGMNRFLTLLSKD
jgi:hypothetical protein